MTASRHLRTAGWSLFLAGLLIGSFAEREAVRTPVRDGEYFVLSGDFHVHAFLGDGALGPSDLRREARRRGLDVIAVTNHNQMVTALMAASPGGRADDVLLIPGDEVTSVGYHMIAVGIRQPIDWRLAPAQAIDAIHAQGGVAIAAHPGGPYQKRYDAESLRSIDGVEVFHPVVKVLEQARTDLPAFFERAQQAKPGVAPIGSSDFHFQAPMGEARTYLLAREFSEAGVLDALKHGRTVVYDDLSRVYGDPRWIAIVERHRVPDPPADSAANTLAVAAAWIGLLLLALC